MTFEEILDQAIAMLQRRGRLTYSTLKRQFQLDDAALDDLKEELIYGQRLAMDEEGRVLVWSGATGTTAPAATAPVGIPAPAPLTYTPPYLAEKILTSRSALEGERKQVTVLFADLKGSMELLADRDPEEARQLLDPVLERMMEAVHRYEGTVNQVMGDGIMALFGAPLAHEDHAVRACYTALAMQDALRRYSDEVRRTHGVEVQIRVGLNSGEVVVRAIDNDLHMDYSAIGQTTHLAARMEQLAPPGSIQLTAETLRLAEDVIQVKPLGPTPIKGLAHPLEVFELVGVRPPRTSIQALAGRALTRFVGRQAEVETMGQAQELASAGHGQLVAVMGEPGVGKTRLFYEFLCAPWSHGWLLLESQATSYGKATPYHPIRELLRVYFQLEARDDERRRCEKVTAKLHTLDPALGLLLPAVLALLDVPTDDHVWQALDPPQRRQRTLDALKRLLLRESQVQPVLLVCENLHWLDTETQAFLDSLIESLPTARLLLLVNYRPEYHHAWGSKTYYTQIRLDSLPAPSAVALLQALLGDDATLEPLKQELMERTEGNPFFLEESVRSLVESQVLVGEPGGYGLARTRVPMQVPPTVQAVLAARIDRLPIEEKALLQTAAVIGKDVPLALLQAITDFSETTLRGALAHLHTVEFLYEARLFPELEYTFKHTLTQEVAYGSLLQERRRTLHARIVAAIEQLSPDRGAEQVERLAYHALRGEVWDKAVVAFQQAGTKAALHSAYHEAVACFEQALLALKHLPECSATLQQTCDVLLELRSWLVPLADYARILDHLREAEAIAERLGDHRRLSLVCAHLTDYFRLTGASEQAVACGERALTFATELHDFALQISATLRLGPACHVIGDYRRAIQLLKHNVELLHGARSRERFGSAGVSAVLARSYLVFPLVELGEFGEALAIGGEALRLAEVADTLHSQALAAHSVGLVYLCRGDVDSAIPLLERTFHRVQSAHIYLDARLLASALGYAYALAGRVAEAVPFLEQAVQQAEALKVLFRYALWLVWLGEVYLRIGRTEETGELAQRAVDWARRHKEVGHEAWALRLLGAAAMHRCPPEIELAEAHYRQALALAEELGMRPLQAHCHSSLGILYAATGQQQQVRTELATAIALYRDMDMTFWLPQTEAALAQVEGQ
jgi:class 3 adenylate cyclase/tetratricopeptide (TPR) repeat protein